MTVGTGFHPEFAKHILSAFISPFAPEIVHRGILDDFLRAACIQRFDSFRVLCKLGAQYRFHDGDLRFTPLLVPSSSVDFICKSFCLLRAAGVSDVFFALWVCAFSSLVSVFGSWIQSAFELHGVGGKVIEDEKLGHVEIDCHALTLSLGE